MPPIVNLHVVDKGLFDKSIVKCKEVQSIQNTNTSKHFFTSTNNYYTLNPDDDETIKMIKQLLF